MTRAMVTKKWKASSTVPPPRLTSTHEADRSPVVARAERQRRPPQESVARAAEAATITTPKASPGPSPTSRASRARAGTCSHRMSRMARWRLRQTSSGSERPWGRVPRTRLSNCTATRTFLLQATPSPAEPTSSAGGSHAQSFAASLRKCTRASVVNRHPTGDWHGPGNLTRFSPATTAERNVILKTSSVQKFRSIEDSGTVRFEPDVTCLVGKNESGKTAFLEALHQANPSGGAGRGFDALRDYPRHLRGRDRAQIAGTVPISATVERTYAGQRRLLVGEEELTGAAAALLADRLPRFLYFDGYSVLPGRVSIPRLQATAEADLQPGERTALALLRLAGVAAEEFTEADYEVRRAALKSAATTVSEEVFRYWSQNPE